MADGKCMVYGVITMSILQQMKPILKKACYIVDNLFWVVGFLSIFNYVSGHSPLAAKLVVFAFLFGFGGWYIWRFFIRPFRTALKGG